MNDQTTTPTPETVERPVDCRSGSSHCSLAVPYFHDDRCTIYHGDARDILPRIEGIDLLFTSPPYGQQRDYERPIDNWITVVPCTLAATPKSDKTQVLVNLGQYHREGEVIEYWDTLKSAMRAEGWRLFGWYVWDQGNGLPGDWNGRLAPSHEFVFHFNRAIRKPNKTKRCAKFGQVSKGSTFRKANADCKTLNCDNQPYNEFKIPDSVIRVPRVNPSTAYTTKHPATFPDAFASEVIMAYTDEGELVVDPFSGSGTTLRAAVDAGRRAVGIEIEERYCEIAANRMRHRNLF